MKQYAYWLTRVTILLVLVGRQENARGQARWIHRPADPTMAEIRTRWVADESEEYSLRGHEFEASTIFKLFDRDYFMANLLPKGFINLRNEKDKYARGEFLDAFIGECLLELQKAKRPKKNYKRFTVLKKNNFNFKRSTGLIIFKPKPHPYDRFVIKLFTETPHLFVRPFHKDLEQNCLFNMAGGVSRYLVGFTRVKNLHYMKHRIEKSPYWSSIMAPCIRKWFWLPSETRWFEVIGYGVNGQKEQRIRLPATYAIVSDAIESERGFSMYNKDDAELVLSLARWLKERLDPNITNYMIEKQTGKPVFIDTEHFPTNLGLRETLGYVSYMDWYFKMTRKYLKDSYCRTKKGRLAIRRGQARPFMQCT